MFRRKPTTLLLFEEKKNFPDCVDLNKTDVSVFVCLFVCFFVFCTFFFTYFMLVYFIESTHCGYVFAVWKKTAQNIYIQSRKSFLLLFRRECSLSDVCCHLRT